MEIVFFGSGAFGTPVLRALAQRHTVRALVTQPDRPAGRGGRTTPTPITAAAAESVPDVPVFKPERVNDPEVRERIRAIGADAWVVIAFGQKLGPDLLDGQFAVNLHGSLLPRWRGAARRRRRRGGLGRPRRSRALRALGRDRAGDRPRRGATRQGVTRARPATPPPAGCRCCLPGESKQEPPRVDLSSLRSFSSNQAPPEAGIPRQLFAAILRLIDGLRPQPAPTWRPMSSLR